MACSGLMYVGVPSVTPVLGELRSAALGDGARDAEIGDQRLTVLQQDVLRLDVAVDDSLLVRVLERRGDLICDPQRVGQRELPLAFETLVDRLAGDERHHVIEMPLVLAEVVDREDVGVTEARDDVDLSAESLGAHREGKFPEEDLDRDVAIQLEIASEPDDRHTSAADLALETVTLSEQRLRLQGAQL